MKNGLRQSARRKKEGNGQRKTQEEPKEQTTTIRKCMGERKRGKSGCEAVQREEDANKENGRRGGEEGGGKSKARGKTSRGKGAINDGQTRGDKKKKDAAKKKRERTEGAGKSAEMPPEKSEKSKKKGKGGERDADGEGGKEEGSRTRDHGEESAELAAPADGEVATGKGDAPGLTVDALAFRRLLEEVMRERGSVGDSAVAGGGTLAEVEAEEDRGSSEAAYWRSQYEQLDALRHTDVERELEQYRKHVQDREAAQQALIAHLKGGARDGAAGRGGHTCTTGTAPAVAAENDEAVEAGVAKEGGENSSTSAYAATLEAKVLKQRRLLLAYQHITSMAIKLKQESAPAVGDTAPGGKESESATMQLECTAINRMHRRVVCFDLTLPADKEGEDEREEGGEEEEEEEEAEGKGRKRKRTDTDVVYAPRANKRLLPSYMRYKVSFPKLQTPLFLVKLLEGLYRAP